MSAPGELRVSGDEMSFILGRIRGVGKPARPGRRGFFQGPLVPPNVVGDGTFKLSIKEIDSGNGPAEALLKLYIGEQLVAEYKGEGGTDMPGEYEGEWRG